MQDQPQLNFPLFFKTEKRLEKQYIVVNPARLSSALWVQRGIIKSIDEWPLCIDKLDEIEKTHRLDLIHYLRNDFANLICCDMIYLMKSWRTSEGSKKELILAEMLELEVMEE